MEKKESSKYLVIVIDLPEFLEIHEECQEIPVGLEDQLAPKQMTRSGIGLEIA